MTGQEGHNRRFLAGALSLDLEVGKRNGRILRFAAVRADNGRSFTSGRGDLKGDLARLDQFAADAAYLVGHNLEAFDIPHLEAASPDLALLRLPRIDTLRLNPLAFPRNPYHHLVKHYHDGELKKVQLNDPKLDSELALELLSDQIKALSAVQATDPDLLLAWHWLTTEEDASGGLQSFFTEIRQAPRASRDQAVAAIQRRFAPDMCQTHALELLDQTAAGSWPLAYALAWLSVAGGDSAMPPWVRHQYPEASRMVQLLRDLACQAPECRWCRTRHDARAELTRWFGFPDYRPAPVDALGRPLQRVIVEGAMAGQHVLGILPTGTGKSLCYQIPALSRYDKTGALTVVISPLVALMADQVAGLERQGISNCAALNGLLSMPERSNVLDRIRLGELAILIISPEQLRGRALRRVLEQRQIGAWVLDEAHCLSKWGHDFRPDYRYIGRYIRERAGNDPVPPVLCLTATAKPEVIEDIGAHFRERLDIELKVYDGGSSRNNLDFAVVQTTPSEKYAQVHQVIEAELPEGADGGAIAYCATRRATEELAAFLQAKGMAAEHYHAGLSPEAKKFVQSRFIDGELQVIVATNAFGMGIDKPDVRLVVHADIPGSLENYLQEAGRAGRDGQPARCVLLYAREDVERQFGMSARSRLKQREIGSILRALRRIDRKRRLGGEVVVTSGEILLEEDQGSFTRDSVTDDTRVRTALAWLEEARLLQRGENEVSIFPSSLRVASVEDARKTLVRRKVTEPAMSQLLSIVTALLQADPDEGVSTDELMGVAGLDAAGVRKALHDLEVLGLATNDTALTAFVHAGIERASVKRLESAIGLETAMIEKLQELAPDLEVDATSILHVRQLSQALRDDGLVEALPERLRRLLRSLAKDGLSQDGGKGSLALRALDRETIRVTLLRSWAALRKTAELRRKAAQALLTHLLNALPKGLRGADLLAETTLGALRSALSEDMWIRSEARDLDKLLEFALLWLHEQEVIRVNKGLVVFRSAMTLRLDERGGAFLKADYEPLQQHYDEQVVQTHVMAEYAERGLANGTEATRLATDYFMLPRARFISKWLSHREKDLTRQTLPETWKSIVDSLNDPVQRRIVADDREQTNVLVLAGPGSGKTRVLVHRIAYLVRVRRENPRGILALAYNRHAAIEIRKRLTALIGDDARRVTVLTCHGLAMRLTGHCFAGRKAPADQAEFAEILRQAVALLRGEGLAPDDADLQREQLLEGFRWILVDEYQDIEATQYELIGALAGRTRPDEEGRLSLFAVGDDDQNIYAFAGASVEFIRRFEEDYAAKPAYLTDNYRSTAHIIAAANQIIEPARQRMKESHPIRIDRRRDSDPPGGALAQWDAVSQGRVQLLEVGSSPVDQALCVMDELRRLSRIVPDWNWARCAVIARHWETLEPVRSYCELLGIPVQWAADDPVELWRLRETQALVDWIRGNDRRLVQACELRQWLSGRAAGPMLSLLADALEAYALDAGEAEQPVASFIEWLVDWGRTQRQRQIGLMLLSAHRAKGLEFDHVAVLDGEWTTRSRGEDPDSPRRLYYVAMTRARRSLLLGSTSKRNPLLAGLEEGPELMRRQAHPPEEAPIEVHRRRRLLSLREVDLSYAGRFAPSHAVNRAIAELSAGDALRLVQVQNGWELQDDQGRPVGRLAKAFRMPPGMNCVAVSVAAILVRFAEDSAPEYRAQLRCERWEVVVPELVLVPDVPRVSAGSPRQKVAG